VLFGGSFIMDVPPRFEISRYLEALAGLDAGNMPG
jgi:hypothetical protein